MPEMSEENYKAIMERLDTQDATIESLNKKLGDLAAMNNVLLQTSAGDTQVHTPAERHKELEKKLKGGLRNA